MGSLRQLFPLIKHLTAKFPDLFQPWYADDAAAAGLLEQLKQCFIELELVGPRFGYFPECTKSICVVHEDNYAYATNFVATNKLGWQVVTGARYLGGHVGMTEDRAEWLREKVSSWEMGVQELATVAGIYPQSAYAGLQKSLQNEWTYIQRVVEGTADFFDPLEKTINTK